MSTEHGVYVELLPRGKIKRDIAGYPGDVPLAEAKISDEIFLFSELIFEPYAVVVDQIHAQARAILMYDDHGGLANMTLFQFMLDTVEDLVSTLELESPLHGPLLRAQLEDEVPPDDGTAMYPSGPVGRSSLFWRRSCSSSSWSTKCCMICRLESLSFQTSTTRCGRSPCARSCAGMEIA